VENLIHIWISLFGAELNEDNHRNCKQTGVEGEESRHFERKELALKHDGIVSCIRIRREGRDRVNCFAFSERVIF